MVKSPKMSAKSVRYVDKARSVIQTEIDGLARVQEGLDQSFVALVDLCLKTIRNGGKLVLSGVGKSGHVGHKVASTLASTGSPAVFMHPVEAMHGDLGILSAKDALIALSYSGETEELLGVLPSVKRFGIPIVAITGKRGSSLANWSDLTVEIAVAKEACPFNLAPTTSTTAMLALGDALAIVLLEEQKLTAEQYGKYHPAGSIGRTVKLTVDDIMRKGDRLAIVQPDTSVQDALFTMTRCRSGSVAVADHNGVLVGIFTDGDLRRHVQGNLNVLQAPIRRVMTPNPIRIHTEHMAIEVLKLLEGREIDDIPVVDERDRIVGMVDIQDLPKFKLM